MTSGRARIPPRSADRTIPAWLLAAWAAYVAMLLPVAGLFHNGPQIAADRQVVPPARREDFGRICVAQRDNERHNRRQPGKNNSGFAHYTPQS
jgi:hypothetical protein